MEATHKATKILGAIFASAGSLGALALFFTYLWPLMGKRWWAIIFLSLVSLALIWLNGIVKTYHERTVKALENIETRPQFLELLAEKKLVQSQLDQCQETWLTLEVDTEGHIGETGRWTQSNVHLIRDEFMLGGPGEAQQIEGFYLHVNVLVRFHNPDIEDNRTRGVDVALWKIVNEQEVFVDRSQMTTQPDRGGGTCSGLLDDFLVQATSSSKDYWLLNFFNLKRADRDDQTLFVKIIMKAFRQPTTTVRVRWNAEDASGSYGSFVAAEPPTYD
jgi:hypothetical protein